MRTNISLLALMILAISPFAAFAHAGHGTLHGHELAHYLTSPAHILPVLGVLALLAYFGFRRFASKSPEDIR